MSSAEMMTRLGEVRRVRQERRIWNRSGVSRPFSSATDFSQNDLIQCCQTLIAGAQRSQLEDAERHHLSRYLSLQTTAQQTAKSVLSGRWSMLGHDFDLSGVIDWHKDPRSEHVWERQFYGDLSFAGRDVKYVWELGRHQYLADLSRAALMARDEAAAASAQSLMVDWIDQNPLYEGVHWTSALEVAMRAISWVWTLAACGDRFDAKHLRAIANSLADHATYLQHHFSYYSSPFNHLIGEATGLYLIGSVLGQHKNSDEWRRLARGVLNEHGPKQFHNDGVCVEQAMGYHFYSLGFLSLSIVAARREGDPLTHLEHVTHQAFRAAAAFHQPDGRWPAFGDLDSARSLPVHHPDYWQFGSLCSLAGVLFDDTELAFDDEPGDEVYWLFGAEGWSQWNKITRANFEPTPQSHHVLADSGYVVAAGPNDWMLFDAGPIAGGLFADSTPSVAHGHADTLQVLFWMDGKSVLGDSGMPYYVGEPGHVDYFRSPAAHNTLEVSGVSIAKNAGKLAWSNVANTPALEAKVGEDAWLAHGRMRLGDGVQIDRYLLGIPNNGIWITDRIHCETLRDVSWYWQLGDHPFQVSQEEHSLCLENDQGVTLKMKTNDKIGDWKLDAASEDSPVGWKALDYGISQRGQRLSLRMPCQGELLMTTYVGRTASPWTLEQVGVGDQTLQWGQPVVLSDAGKTESPAPGNSEQAEIVWTLVDGEDRRTFLAGLTPKAVHQTPPFQEVSGAGDWSVFCIDHNTKQWDASQAGVDAVRGESP